jgi:hypothetical protein
MFTNTTIHPFPQATRSPETERKPGGWATPAGPTPAAKFLRDAGECGGDSLHANPACAMIAARAPSTRPAPMSWVCLSGVKSAATGNRPTVASLSSEGSSLTIQGGTSRRKERPAKTADPKPQGGGHTLEPKGKGHEARETGWTPHRKFGMISGSSAEAPAGCSGPPRAQQTAKERGNRRALSIRKGREGFWPHARGGQVADNAKARGNARDMQNSAKGRQNELTI